LPVDLELKHGDIYIMSQKATGNDWKQASQYRLVHGAGAAMHIQVRPEPASVRASLIPISSAKGKGTKRKATQDAQQPTLFSFVKSTANKDPRVA
jgi:hypothetical protein